MLSHVQLDTIVRKSVMLSSPERLWQFYRDAGYPVECYHDVQALPQALREEKVSRLRGPCRLCVIAEMGISTVTGPLAPLVGLPLLAVILLKWTVDAGWCYGLDMRNQHTQRDISRLFMNHFNQVIWPKNPEALVWRRVSRTVGQLLLMGWGQELKWADQIIAKIRGELRETAWVTQACTSCVCKNRSLRNSGHSRSGPSLRRVWQKTIRL